VLWFFGFFIFIFLLVLYYLCVSILLDWTCAPVLGRENTSILKFFDLMFFNLDLLTSEDLSTMRSTPLDSRLVPLQSTVSCSDAMQADLHLEQPPAPIPHSGYPVIVNL
jgi:hypothetical protein